MTAVDEREGTDVLLRDGGPRRTGRAGSRRPDSLPPGVPEPEPLGNGGGATHPAAQDAGPEETAWRPEVGVDTALRLLVGLMWLFYSSRLFVGTYTPSVPAVQAPFAPAAPRTLARGVQEPGLAA